MKKNHLKSQLARVGLVLAALAVTGAAQARNDKHLLPIDAALRSSGTGEILRPDVQLRFGRATAAGADITNPQVEVRGEGETIVDSGTGHWPYNKRVRRTDAEACVDAFRNAVVELQKRARASGAIAIVGIVSNYDKSEMDNADVYECRAGYMRAVVDLKGQAARSMAAQQPQAQPVTPRPTPMTAAVPVAAAAVIPMIATGFANINDIDAIPYLSDKGREAYREYLGRPTPKAFALSPSGNWFSASTLVGEAGLPSDPVERAVVACNRTSSTPCKLYAVNGAVVWTKP